MNPLNRAAKICIVCALVFIAFILAYYFTDLNISPAVLYDADLPTATAAPSPIVSDIPSQNANKTDLININTATAAELDTLPGIGEVLAQKIIEYRAKNGLFSSISDIKGVSGIGDAKFEAIRSLICV